MRFEPEKGFAEFGVYEDMVVIGQTCGDAKYWKKLGEEIVILFVDANFYSRSKRNNKREKLGGHKVEDETFRSIYRFSCKPKNEKIIQVKSNVSLQKLFNKIGEQL